MAQSIHNTHQCQTALRVIRGAPTKGDPTRQTSNHSGGVTR